MNRLSQIFIFTFLFISSQCVYAQTKILFDATKAEAAGNADWVIDADLNNLGYSSGPAVPGGGNESNPQVLPTPAQSTVTPTTVESYWKGGISSWGIDLVKKGYLVETLPYNGQITYGNTANTQDLANYKVFIVCEPNIMFTASEKTALMQFVQNGGGLFMVSDHDVSDRNNDGADSPHIWNDFMTNNGVLSNPFGMTFDYANFSQTTSNVPTLPGDPLLHGVMGDVTQAMWSAGTSITLSPANNSSILGVIYKTGSTFGNTNAMVAYATYGSGRVVGIGDSSPCDDGSGDSGDVLYDGWIADAGGNHRTLIINATIWLASSNALSPTVTTTNVSAIGSTTAMSGGNVTASGSTSVTARGVCWSTAVNPVATDNHTSDGSGTGTYTSSITGLSAGTLYHIRAYASNSVGIAYGGDLQFTTSALLPTVTTATPSSITTTSAACGGTVSADGGASVTSRGICWSTSANPLASGNHTTDGSGTGTFNSSISGLTASTLYHVRAYATNSVGTNYGSDLQFTTAALPTLNVSPANQSVTASSGTTSFQVNSNSSWSASSDQLWCTVSLSGTGNGIITGTYSVNTAISSRTASITVSVTGLTPVVVTVTQAGALPVLTVTPPDQGVTASAGSALFTVTSNTGWTAVSNQPWCAVTAAGSGNGIITANFTENLATSARVANITVSVAGLVPLLVTVTQAAAAAPEFLLTVQNLMQTSASKLEFDVYLLDNDPLESFELASIQFGFMFNSGIYTGGSVNVAINNSGSGLNPSQQFTAVPNVIATVAGYPGQSLLRLAGKVPPGAGGGTIISTSGYGTLLTHMIMTSTMPFTASSTADFVFLSSSVIVPLYATRVARYVYGGPSPVNTQLTVTPGYNANVVSNTVLNPPAALSVTPLNRDVPASAGNTTYSLTSNASWTATCNQGWCTLTPSGFGNGTISAVYAANPTSVQRVAEITVSVTGLSPTIVTITQAGLSTKVLNLTLFLQGLYNGFGTMHPVKDGSGVHLGSTIADKITIELHDYSNYSNIIFTLSNIDLHTDGTASVSIPSIYNGSYYLTVKHRNSIETVSAETVSFSGTVINYSFNMASKARGSNLGMMTDGWYVIYGGDVNQDGFVDTGDMTPVDNDSFSYMSGYLNSDTNGDGAIDTGDMTIVDNNAANYISSITP